MRSSSFIVFFLVVFAFAMASASAEEAAAAQSANLDWKAVGGNGLLMFLQVLGTAIASLLGAALLWVVRLVASRFNVQISAEMDAQVYAAADKAVHYAEEWARKNAGATGSEKADMALQFMQEMLDSKVYKTYGEPAIRSLIDSAVAKMRSQAAS